MHVLEDHIIQQSDCTQAYTQALLGGKKTYIRIPKHRWPDSWHKLGFNDPCCRLQKALYGHPQSGGFWEEHCNAKISLEGFIEIGTCNEWKSCFYHPIHRTVLIVYVDDMLMAGPASGVETCWKLLRNGERAITMDEPTTASHFPVSYTHLTLPTICRE